ncbi:MAG: hypothetical protein HC851_23600 [Acaryochloris sp. RU_4_1]|nr:hypothetical protein [Acaryochloris sp. RU_4_1]
MEPDRPADAIAKLRQCDRWASGFRDAIATQGHPQRGEGLVGLRKSVCNAIEDQRV